MYHHGTSKMTLTKRKPLRMTLSRMALTIMTLITTTTYRIMLRRIKLSRIKLSCMTPSKGTIDIVTDSKKKFSITIQQNILGKMTISRMAHSIMQRSIRTFSRIGYNC